MDRAESESPHVVSVHGIAAGGDGVGTLQDGRVVFLPRTAPGDRVGVHLLQQKSRWARGEALDLIQEGPGRVLPPCPHFDDCDGCSMQHLAYEEQLAWKGRWVGDALRRIGGLEVQDPRVARSPHELGYRNRVTLTLRRLPGGGLVAGFRDRRRRSRVLDVGTECLLPQGDLREVWHHLRIAWSEGKDLLPSGLSLIHI